MIRSEDVADRSVRSRGRRKAEPAPETFPFQLLAGRAIRIQGKVHHGPAQLQLPADDCRRFIHCAGNPEQLAAELGTPVPQNRPRSVSRALRKGD